MKSQKLKKLKNNAKNYNMYRMESEEIDYPEEDLFGSDSDEDTNQTYDDYVLDLQESAARQLGQRELDIDKRTDLSKFEKILLKLDAAHDIYKDDTKFEYIQDIPIPKRNPELSKFAEPGEDYPYVWQQSKFPDPIGKRIRRETASPIQSFIKDVRKGDDKFRKSAINERSPDQLDKEFSEYLRRTGGKGSLQTKNINELNTLRQTRQNNVPKTSTFLRTKILDTETPIDEYIERMRRNRRQAGVNNLGREIEDMTIIESGGGRISTYKEPILEDLDYRKIRPGSQISKRQREREEEYRHKKREFRRKLIENNRKRKLLKRDNLRQESEFDITRFHEDGDESIASGTSFIPINISRGTRSRGRVRGRARGTRSRGRQRSRGRSRGFFSSSN